MMIVIGSGPAGVSCAKTLLDRGLKVTLIDVGHELEPALSNQLKNLSSKNPSEWDSESVAAIKKNTDANPRGIPEKRVYGSRFHLKDVEETLYEKRVGVNLAASLAKGGLSNVWGAAVLPYNDHDLSDWPIGEKELAPFYKKIFEFMPLAGKEDELSPHFPLYAMPNEKLPLSRQAQALLQDLSKGRDRLKEKGMVFGESRLAVWPKCVQCGLCLYGCPHFLIYSSAQTLGELQKNSNFTYAPHTRVLKVFESDQGVTVESPGHTMNGRRVFLAAGVLGTAKILLESQADYKSELTIRTSQHFMLPFFRKKSISSVTTENLHTLSQLFIEVLDSGDPKKNFHLQIYTYNDLFKKALSNATLGLGGLVSHFILGRLLLIQGYLHSDYSSSVKIRLNADTKKLEVEPIPNRRTSDRVKSLITKLKKSSDSFGSWFLGPLMKVSDPGVGAHMGGTFPMSLHPSSYQTNLHGLLHGTRRIHVVDASVFPSIPPTTITLALMANAARIAAQSPDN